MPHKSTGSSKRQRGWKLYSFHAPEVECIGKGKASAPYEFGVKTSIVTTNARAPGGQAVLYTKTPAIPTTVIPLKLSSKTIFISGQKRGVFGIIERELRRRSAIEAVIGHMKGEGNLGRCYLKGREGDAANAILPQSATTFASSSPDRGRSSTTHVSWL